MAEINADVEVVIGVLTEKLVECQRENAILTARLIQANKMLDEDAEKAAKPAAKEPKS